MTKRDLEQLNEARRSNRALRIENETLRRRNHLLEHRVAGDSWGGGLPSPFDVYVWDGKVSGALEESARF